MGGASAGGARRSTGEPSPWTDAFLAALIAGLRAAGDAERAEQMRRYMRDQFDFFGVPTPERRAITRRVLSDVGPPAPEDLETLGPAAWAVPQREPQYAAVDVLGRHVRRAQPELLDVVAELVLATPWWDTVDALAAKVVGPLVSAFPELVATLDDWIAGDDLWLARTAILHQLGYRDRTDPERLFRYCLAWADHPDFFARKAIGWALRQYGDQDPDAVRTFLADHRGTFSPLTVREASKRL